MLSSTTLSFCVLLALAALGSAIVVVRDSPVSLPMAKKFQNFKMSGKQKLVEIDQRRAAMMRSRGKNKHDSRATSFSVTNQLVYYSANVSVGYPATAYGLLIDTGSSNTWLGAGKTYKTTNTSRNTNQAVAVSYGSGSFSGKEYTDQVKLASSLVITGQSIGVADSFRGFDAIDGILGIGPVGLTRGQTLASFIGNVADNWSGTLQQSPSTSIPTVTDNLFKQGTISSNQIAISFNPISRPGQVNGELTFGGTDSTKFTGSINYSPITNTYPASAYWGINQYVTYGNISILSNAAGIVDTGTTLILLATDAFNRYQTATGAVADKDTGLLRLTPAQYANLRSLFFTINGIRYELTANAQIWPRALNSYVGGSSGDIYSIVADIGSTSGEGLDFINGFTFLERFYSVYDTQNRRVGLATTPNTKSLIN